MNFYFCYLLFLIAQVNSLHLNDDKLFKIYINNPKDGKLLRSFELENSDSVDLWTHIRPNTKILAQLKGEAFEKFKNLNIPFEIAKDNVTKLFEESILQQKMKNQQRTYISANDDQFLDNFNLNEYHSYDEIIDYLINMQKTTLQGVDIKMTSIGRTHENRQINALIIKAESLTANSKVLLLECGIHAREWVSGASCLKIIDKLLVNQDNLSKNILSNYEIHVIPIMNPDGYEYSRNHMRQWRKNRSNNYLNFSICKGTDINRNFDIGFGTVGVDAHNPCSIIYCGKSAFSEKESQALRDHVLKIKNRLHTYISLHSFSQLILYPYGYKENVPKNNKELDRLAQLAQDAIKAKQGEEYKAGNIYTAIYPASGASIDWIAVNSKSKYNYCFEMRDTGEYGFLLPERFIEPAFQDIWVGIDQIISNMRD